MIEIKEYIKKIIDKVINKNVEIQDLLKVKSNSLVIDNETVNDINKGEKNYPYDISIMVIDSEGKILFKYTLVISEIYEDEIKMSSAFYGNKRPFYDDMLDILSDTKDANKKYFKEVSMDYAITFIERVIKKYKCKYLYAFNVSFDFKSIMYLHELAKRKSKTFHKLTLIDIRIMFLRMLVDFPKFRKQYFRFCKKHNFLTEKGFIKTDVETIMRFYKKNPNFKEKHNGLDDLKQEIKIRQKIVNAYAQESMKLTYNSKLGVSLYKGANALLKAN